jgi:signal transduction histidine kinase
MNNIRNYLLFFILLLVQTFEAQNPQNFSIERITQDDGLSQGSNYFRFEDRKGFMWITCNDALNRFDGSTVKVYNLNYFFKNCPALQQGYGFAEDDKNLFVGSTRGLYSYDYDLDEFRLIEIFKNSKTKTAMPIGFFGGKIWCFNENWQLASYDVKTKKVKSEAQIPLTPIKSVHVYDNEGNLFYYRMPFLDSNGNICFTGKENIAVYTIQNKKIKFPVNDLLKEEKYTFIASINDKLKDKAYFGTTNGAIILFENNFQKVKKLFLEGESIFNIAIHKNKLILKTSYNKAPTIYSQYLADKELNTVEKIDIPNLKGYCYAFDRAGRLWSCDDGKGQIIINFNGTFLKNSNNIANLAGFKGIGVANFSEMPNKKILISATYIFDGHKIEEKKESKYNRSYADMYREGNWMMDKYWDISTYFKICFVNKNNEKSIDFTINSKGLGGLQHLVSLPDKFPIISFSNGLFWLNTKTGQLEKINSLPDKNPFYINPLTKNRIAISYLNRDMVLAEIQTDNSFKILKKILPGVQSFYLQEDIKKGEYWVGTNEGVYLLDKNFRILKKFDSNNGLAGTYIYGILIDDLGNVWCSHQHGLSSIDGRNYHIINYDKNDGIQDWDFNNRAFLKASDGTLYFGGVSGFNYIKPPLKFSSFYKPEIYFDEILINSKRLVTEEGYNLIAKLDLKNDENNIIIKALIKDLELGKQRRIYYRILENKGDWKAIPHKQPLIFNSLSPGNYHLEFGIYDKFSGKISNFKKLEISISKAFYQTIWFWAFLGALFSGLFIYLFSKWKFVQQQREFREHLALEEQRNKITADLHDDLGATLSSLQINSAIASKLLEKDKEQAKKILKNIELQSKHISENIGDIIWSLKPGKDEFMSLSTRILNFASEVLGGSEIAYSMDINPEIDEKITDFKLRKNIVLLCKEALNNIAKYSQATEVKLILKSTNSEYILEISDNGIGFDPEKITGNGIRNMKKRTEEMNGIFKISSNPGTVINIRIPIFRDLK